MRISGINFTPYIYNTNILSRSSLSKVASIGEDLLSSKTDFSSLTDEDLNENPLRKGQTSNWMDVLDMQMQMGRMNASRIMKPAKETQGLDEIPAQSVSSVETAQLSDAEAAIQSTMPTSDGAAEAVDMTEDFQPVSSAGEMLSMYYDRNLFQMQRAAEAYRVNMIA